MINTAFHSYLITREFKVSVDIGKADDRGNIDQIGDNRF